MTTYINATPHAIVLNNGTVFEPELLARVKTTFSEIVNGECTVIYGDVEGLPAPEAGKKYIVSAMVLAGSTRDDLVAPATGHPETVRNEKGHVVSVPCFVK